ncbi:MAG: GNAT family N-acetyltransferase [Candidatus Azobacteroides sp.]|nr:GNAT family N-acetyltransferase [Candidatus Azobacteroides sp.]
MIDYVQVELVKLSSETSILTFDCGDMDLNNFLLEDALHYLNERMAVTYLLTYQSQIIAYFCLLNDKVTFDTTDEKEKSFWNRFNRKNKIPNHKRRQNYPAVKIGRLAVDKMFSGQKIGHFLLESIKSMMIKKNDIACRFLTVDAYQTALDFYLRNEFHFISVQDENDSTRLMYFDLK